MKNILFSRGRALQYALFAVLFGMLFFTSCAGALKASLAETAVSTDEVHQAAHQAIGQEKVIATVDAVTMDETYGVLFADPVTREVPIVSTKTGDEMGTKMETFWSAELLGPWTIGSGNYNIVTEAGAIPVQGDRLVFPLQVQTGDWLTCRLRIMSETKGGKPAEVLFCEKSGRPAPVRTGANGVVGVLGTNGKQ